MSTDVADHVAGDGSKQVKDPAAAGKVKEQTLAEQLLLRQTALEVLTECAIPVKVALIDELVTKSDAKEMKTLAESWTPEKKGKTKPRLNLTEAINGSAIAKYPEDAKSFARAAKGRA